MSFFKPTEPGSARAAYFRLLGYLRDNKRAFILGVLGAVMFATAQTGFVWLMKPFIDQTFFAQNKQMVIWVPLGLIGIFILRGGGEFIQTYYMGHVGRRVIKVLRGQLFDRLLYLPITYFDRTSSAVMLSRVIYNTEQVAVVVTDAVTTAFRESLSIIGYIVALFYFNAKLAMVVFFIGPMIAGLITMINRQFRNFGHRIQDTVSDVTRVAKEALDAPRVIKVFNAQEYERAQFEAANENNRRTSMKMLRLRGMASPIVQVIASLALAAVLWIGTKQAVNKEITPGEFFGFIGALIALMQPLRSLVNVFGPIQGGVAAAQSLFAVIDEPAEKESGTHRVARVRGDVEYRDVTFSYKEGHGQALKEMSLHIQPGETVAFVGRSGSGKSTTVNLLPRFYDLSVGSILIDGVDVRDYELHTLREQIALVSQDVVLFDDTIINNIAFGRPASPDALMAAARAAHVLEFAERLPDGMETRVGERGVLLSGGQKQRISIARALLKDAPILILDEATSALDTESERTIQAALEELMQNRTTLVIAHRLSTIENADRIVVMDGGRIVEVGTHRELIEKGGAYAALHRMQFNV